MPRCSWKAWNGGSCCADRDFDPRQTPLLPNTSATSVTYAVQFSQAVTGVDPTDFQVYTDSSVQTTTPVAVAGSSGSSSYTVTINGIQATATCNWT